MLRNIAQRLACLWARVANLNELTGNSMNEARMGILLIAMATLAGQASPSVPLALETTIPLPEVQGRIDHLSADLKNQRLFVGLRQ